jgi:hypothetical protein
MIWTRSLPNGRCILLVSEVLLRGSGTKRNFRMNLMASIPVFIILVCVTTLNSITLLPHLR